MSDLTTHSLGRAARTETLPPADGAKGDAKTQALKGRGATLDAGGRSRLAGLGQVAKTLGNPNQAQAITARSVRMDADKPGPQRIAQAPHDGKPDVEVFGKGGVAARGAAGGVAARGAAEPTYPGPQRIAQAPHDGKPDVEVFGKGGVAARGAAEPTYQNAKAHELEPQYANAKFAKGEVESGYSVLKQEEGSQGTAQGTGRARADSGHSMLENSLYVSADKANSKSSSALHELPYLTPRDAAGLRGTFRTLSDRMASVGNAPPPRLERLKAAVQRLFDAVKSLVSRVAEVRSRPSSQPPRVASGGESWRDPALARRTLPQPPSQRAGAVPSGYESGGQGQQVRAQTPVSADLSATERYEERLRTDMKNLGETQKATVRRLASEIDTIISRSETLDIEVTEAQELQIAQNRHDIALVLENFAKEQAGGGSA